RTRPFTRYRRNSGGHVRAVSPASLTMGASMSKYVHLWVEQMEARDTPSQTSIAGGALLPPSCADLTSPTLANPALSQAVVASRGMVVTGTIAESKAGNHLSGTVTGSLAGTENVAITKVQPIAGSDLANVASLRIITTDAGKLFFSETGTRNQLTGELV